jgi:cellobiose-specific phosphotransferase system component IIA
VLWAIGTVFLIVDLQIARIKSFLLFLRLNDLIEENDRLAKEFHSSEMRFLIANVAHDLKTVSRLLLYFRGDLLITTHILVFIATNVIHFRHRLNGSIYERGRGNSRATSSK